MDSRLQELAEMLRVRYRGRLHQVLFFGSRARGDASVESDYDCLLVFDQTTPSLRSDLDHFVAQLLLERGMVLSCIPLSQGDLQRLQYEPFIQNARREGIAA